MGILLFGLLTIVGLVLAYGGYQLYTFAIFLLGAVVSAGGFYLLTEAQGSSPDLVGVLGVGLVGGLVFLLVQFLAVLAAGFILGWMGTIMLGIPDDTVQLVGGLVGAGLSLVLYVFVVIVATAGIGALLVAKAIAAGPSADVHLFLLTKESTPVFWIVFVTGALIQFGALAAETEE